MLVDNISRPRAVIFVDVALSVNSQSKLSERATLPADDVIKSVPPENYETVSNKSESNGLYDQPADTDRWST